MMFKDMCPYYTPCGFCTKFDNFCNEVCGKKDKVGKDKIKNPSPKPKLKIKQVGRD